MHVQVRQRLSSELDRAFFLVMDFVDGEVLECNISAGSLLQNSQVLENLGSIIALDIFLNNSDRFPVVHDNEGNAKNIMIEKNGQVVAIDNIITCMDPQNSYSQAILSRYLSRIETFLRVILSGKTKI